jgi:hypothetical protein
MRRRWKAAKKAIMRTRMARRKTENRVMVPTA